MHLILVPIMLRRPPLNSVPFKQNIDLRGMVLMEHE
jgi:hypothetical protein